MPNILAYIFASAFSGVGSAYSTTAATCMVNGKLVECPKWLGNGLLPSAIVYLVAVAVGILMLISMWVIFKKAGKPGWAAIIPIYNSIVMIEIAKKPTWWILLYFIPFVNIVISVIVLYNLALNFKKGGGFTVGLVFLPFIFYPILAFGKSAYTPAVQVPAPPATPPQATV
ncbi:MAG: DUF5684 domain-containing protein [Patescibacteria group bacterium]